MNLTLLFIFVPVLCVVSYLIGSIPFGMIYARIRGVDIRKVGSGNIGATNVSRQFGFWGGFVPVFALDFLKGVIPALAARLLFDLKVLNSSIADVNTLLVIVIGFMAIIGHTFPVYLGFKGGKGVATSAGVVVVLAPVSLAACLVVFGLVLAVSRIVSVSSIFAAVALPFAVYFLEPLVFKPFSLPLFITGVLITILIIVLHRSNIVKLFKGEEKRIGGGKDGKKKESKPARKVSKTIVKKNSAAKKSGKKKPAPKRKR